MDDSVSKAIDIYEGCMRKARLRSWFYRMLSPLRCIRYGHQRIRKGFCDMDVMDIDHWFCQVLPPMLDQFRRETDTIPHSVEERFTDSDGNLDEEAAMDYWDKELRKMIFLFSESKEDTIRSGKLKGETYMEMCKKQAFSMFCEYFHDLWV